MTRAVCLGCGAFKVGAFTACPSCGHDPTTPEEQARHVLVSDQVLDDDALIAISEQVARGEPVHLDPEAVASWTASIEETPVPPVWFALLVVCGPVFLIAAVVVLSVYLLAG